MINDLEEKLNGTIPVTRKELLELVSSWGINNSFLTYDDINIKKCKRKECYNLSNLDVSEIKDFTFIFRESYYNGDLSKWDLSNCISMNKMFSYSEFNNDSIKNWDVSNVKFMDYTFYQSKFNNDSLNYWDVSKIESMDNLFCYSQFNGNISNWNIINVKNMTSTFDACPFDGDISKWKFHKNIECNLIFHDNDNFKNKYNNCKIIPYRTEEFLEWFEKNRLNISNINISKKEINDIDDYLDSFEFENNIKII